MFFKNFGFWILNLYYMNAILKNGMRLLVYRKILCRILKKTHLDKLI